MDGHSAITGQRTGVCLQTLSVLVVVQSSDGAVVIQRTTAVANLWIVSHHVRTEVPKDGGRESEEKNRVIISWVPWIGMTLLVA